MFIGHEKEKIRFLLEKLENEKMLNLQSRKKQNLTFTKQKILVLKLVVLLLDEG